MHNVRIELSSQRSRSRWTVVPCRTRADGFHIFCHVSASSLSSSQKHKVLESNWNTSPGTLYTALWFLSVVHREPVPVRKQVSESWLCRIRELSQRWNWTVWKTNLPSAAEQKCWFLFKAVSAALTRMGTEDAWVCPVSVLETISLESPV